MDKAGRACETEGSQALTYLPQLVQAGAARISAVSEGVVTSVLHPAQDGQSRKQTRQGATDDGRLQIS